ncbi:hypothetical protein C4J98_0135 [Pseudomonas orientalis]|uniref:hypothetical protein n=1 Tax=Pseudomonas orientalis TaxID=76758 RepID=UPI000F71AD55|nr:hypothetical protein [Pseudomonas orientalis]AZE81581.1 hypothetical protein C4J98_0135 [Pseudomonas orientalis]
MTSNRTMMLQMLEEVAGLSGTRSWRCPTWKGDLSHSFIANSPARKKLLNCMSHRRAHEPHIQSMQIAQDTTWIMATDGFWAELSAEDQFKAIVERTLDGCATEDDVTFMLLRT